MLAADHAARVGKPIVCIKVGRTSEGRSMAKSHTGHLTGSDAVMSAVFRQFGITRVDGLDELTDVAAMFARTKRPKTTKGTRGVAVYAISGGTGAHMADLCAAAGLQLPDLAKSTQKKLREWIPGYLRVSNPVDSGGAPSADERGPKILKAMIDDPNVEMIICPITGALATMSKPLARDLVAAADTTDKPIFVVWGSPDGSDPVYTDILLGSQLPVFRTFHNCVQAARAWFDRQEFEANYALALRQADHPQLAGRPPRPSALLASGRALSEYESKQLLSAYGIPVTDDRLASPRRPKRPARQRTSAIPVVMKVSSPDLLHKSDLGLVEVGLNSAAEVKRAYNDLLERAQKADKKATIDGVIVTELVTGGVETVVGVSTDELFGPVVMFGLGWRVRRGVRGRHVPRAPLRQGRGRPHGSRGQGVQAARGDARSEAGKRSRPRRRDHEGPASSALDHADSARRARHQPAARRAEACRCSRRPRRTEMKDQTAIVGVGQTAFAKGLPQSEKQLALEAIVAALDDAGIEPGEVDGLSSYTLETTEEIDIARNLGTGDITYFSQVGYGGGAGCAVVGHAAMAVATGQCKVAVAWRSRKRGAASARPWAGVSNRIRGPPAVDPPVGTAASGRRDRHAHASIHARVRRDPRPSRQRRAGDAQARQPQPRRDDVRQAAHPRRVHGCPLDLRAALPLRQLPRVRRRRARW